MPRSSPDATHLELEAWPGFRPRSPQARKILASKADFEIARAPRGSARRLRLAETPRHDARPTTRRGSADIGNWLYEPRDWVSAWRGVTVP